MTGSAPRLARRAARRPGCAPESARSFGAATPEQVEHGREDVHQPHRRVRARVPGTDPRPAHEEGDAQGRLVGEEAVQGLPVLAQALAVVGGHEEQRVVPQAESVERVVEPAHQLVGEGHLAVVGAPGDSGVA